MMFVFPGQGSQYVGMGKDWYSEFAVARNVFHEIDDVLNIKMSDKMFCGSEEELALTYNTQPSIMAVSMAIFSVLLDELRCKIEDCASHVMGHSLGEYSALCALDTLSLRDTAKLLYARGLAMHNAAPDDGKMLALIGVRDLQALEDLIDHMKECFIANDNGGGQVVISGTKDGVEEFIAKASSLAIRRMVPINVTIPCHCNLIKDAALAMQPMISEVNFSKPLIPLISNVTARFVPHGEMKELLIKQVFSRVRWRESIMYAMENGVKHYVEFGSNVLSNLIKRIDSEAIVHSIKNCDDLYALLESGLIKKKESLELEFV